MTSNPYESPDTLEASIKHPQASKLRILGYVIGAVVILGLLVAMMLPVTRRGRPSSEYIQRIQCSNNAKQISLALLNYESEHGALPPAYTIDGAGNRLHSWRTLILPYLEEKSLYESIDLTKPWDHPDNAAARETSVPAYRCPAAEHDDFFTTYLAPVGAGFCFDGSAPRSLDEITDGTSKTIMVIDVPSENAVHWMSPHDADEELVQKLNTESPVSHNGMLVTASADGAVHTVYVDDDPERRRAQLTIGGGEHIEFE